MAGENGDCGLIKREGRFGRFGESGNHHWLTRRSGFVAEGSHSYDIPVGKQERHRGVVVDMTEQGAVVAIDNDGRMPHRAQFGITEGISDEAKILAINHFVGKRR